MTNSKFLYCVALAFSMLATIGCSKDEMPKDVPIDSLNASAKIKVTETMPNGAHYNLNIIGVPKDKEASMTGNNGHRIFVPLEGHSKIMLQEGEEFSVLDANGTDGNAIFQLPNPDPDGDGTSSYSIWMRALGKPGGSAVITTCADADLLDGYYEVCSAENLEVSSKRGRSSFENVSRTLLTIYVENDIIFTDSDGVEQTIKAGRYNIFDDTFEDYFWSYDNDGLKLLQLRFYEVPTDIS